MAESISKCLFFLFLLCSFAMSSMPQLEGKKRDRSFPSSWRKLSLGFNAVLHDTNTLPTTPDGPSPIIVTVPATNPVTMTPANPSTTPLPIPTTTPVTVPSTNPNNPTVPITSPVTTPAPITVPGAQPVTNPVTTYPSPAAGGGVPVTTPVTNPISPPAATNAPAIPGQSWCVVRTGAPETSLQSALDYACGMGGADCSQIQQGGSCYSPATLENHASYAFNSYYQRNPAPTSCDFGGTAIIVSTNPSSGSCIYPASATAAASTTPSTATPTPITTPSTATPTPITTPSTATTTSGSGILPSVLNSSTPGSSTTTIPGFDTPPTFNSSTSMSSRLQPFVGFIILVTSFIARPIILDT